MTWVVNRVLPEGKRRDALRGHLWLGHAVHPLLTDFPLGMWTSAIVLDLVGGRRAQGAAQRLVGLGVLAAAPTALTGWAEWVGASQRDKRVGIVHAATNAAAIAMFARSWTARRADEHARGVALALAGGFLATAGGYLGGHLTEVRKLSSSHPTFTTATDTGTTVDAALAPGTGQRDGATAESDIDFIDPAAPVVAETTTDITNDRDDRGHSAP